MGSTNDKVSQEPGVDAVVPHPCPIQVLPEDVVNRIAAGEVVISPSAALKELLENSLDAGASTITVSVRGGGARLLQVCDDGKGIPRDDFPLLCKRYATSKLKTYEDLREIATFGFRGEALASISQVARVSVLSRQAESKCAFSAKFVDGDLSSTPEPCAGVPGTTLAVEDLFYNLPTRRRALRASHEEYRAIVDIVARYAIRYSGVAFVCKRVPEGSGSSRALASGPDVRTVQSASVQDNIRATFGTALARELIQFQVSLPEHEIETDMFATNPGYHMKKGIFVLFINGRLVECSPLKRALDAAYAPFLPRGMRGFLYADVRMRPQDIDVNVHPNKKEVRFLHEPELVQAAVEALETNLKAGGKSRTFMTQSIIGSDGLISMFPTTTPSPSSPDQDVAAVPGAAAFDTPASNTDAPSAGSREASQVAREESQGTDLRSDSSPSQRPDKKLSATLRRGQEEEPGHRRKRLRTQSRVASLIDLEAAGDGGTDEEAENSGGSGDDTNSFIDDASVDEGTDHSPAIPVEPENSPPMDSAADAGASSQRAEGAAPSRSSPEGGISQRPQYSKDKVRVNRLAPIGAMDKHVLSQNRTVTAAAVLKSRKRDPDAPPCLTSIEEAIKALARSAHPEVGAILKDHAFVGIVSEKYVMIQYQTKLVLMETQPFVEELLYRHVLTRFADLDAFQLNPAAELIAVLNILAEDDQGEANVAPTSSDLLAAAEILVSKAALLEDYFAIKIVGETASTARLLTLPVLLPGMQPDLSRFPDFLWGISKVNWSAERPCLLGIARALAGWYSTSFTLSPEFRPVPATQTAKQTSESVGSSSANDAFRKENDWYYRHVLFEAFRTDFDPPKSLAGALREVTSTQRLYKIFERC